MHISPSWPPDLLLVEPGAFAAAHHMPATPSDDAPRDHEAAQSHDAARRNEAARSDDTARPEAAAVRDDAEFAPAGASHTERQNAWQPSA